MSTVASRIFISVLLSLNTAVVHEDAVLVESVQSSRLSVTRPGPTGPEPRVK